MKWTGGRKQAERKRDQERLRRDVLKEAIECLQSILLENDDNFREEATRRSSIQGLRATHTATSVTNNEEHLSFTRVEIINQASQTIEAVCLENQRMRDASSAGPPQMEQFLRSKPRVVFHQGVGPMASTTRTTHDDIASVAGPKEPTRFKCQEQQGGGGQEAPNVPAVKNAKTSAESSPDKRHAQEQQGCQSTQCEGRHYEPDHREQKALIHEEHTEPLLAPHPPRSEYSSMMMALGAERNLNQGAALVDPPNLLENAALTPASASHMLSICGSLLFQNPGALPQAMMAPAAALPYPGVANHHRMVAAARYDLEMHNHEQIYQAFLLRRHQQQEVGRGSTTAVGDECCCYTSIKGHGSGE